MGFKQKQMLMRQKAYFEQQLQERMLFLTGKGITSLKADKDTIVKKMLATIRRVNKKLRLIADSEKKTVEMAKIKAERAAAPQQEKEVVKGEKSKKVSEEGKGKKIKADKKAAASKAPEGGKSQKTTDSAGEAKAPKKKKGEETKG